MSFIQELKWAKAAPFLPGSKGGIENPQNCIFKGLVLSGYCATRVNPFRSNYLLFIARPQPGRTSTLGFHTKVDEHR